MGSSTLDADLTWTVIVTFSTVGMTSAVHTEHALFVFVWCVRVARVEGIKQTLIEILEPKN
jgi:hypothetical protein